VPRPAAAGSAEGLAGTARPGNPPLPTGAAPLGGDGAPHAPRPGGARGRRAARRRSLGLLLVGLVLFGLLLVHADPDAVGDRLGALGWYAPLVLVPYVVIAIFDTMAWRRTLRPEDRRRVRFPSLYLIRMAGEAVNSVTPTAAVGGEPVKAWMLRAHGVPVAEGMAAVVIAKTALVAAQSLFTAIGVAAFLEWLGRRQLAAAWMALLALAVVGFTLLLIAVQKRNPAATLWRWAHRFFPRSHLVARLEGQAGTLDRRLLDFYRMEQHGFFQASGCNFVAWLLGVVETQVILALIGSPIAWLDALIIETIAQPIRAAAIVVPGAVGTQEIGGVWLCTYLGMPEPVAVTLWILKRAREVAFDGVGLAYLSLARKRHAS
jgi:putative membrane protein